MDETMNTMQVMEESVPEARPIETIEAEIWLFKQQAGMSILEIGRRLIEAKAQLEHGEWLVWLAEKVEFSEATAQRFMRLAREYPNPSPVTDLGASKALALLALPASEREEFVSETHTVNGEEKTVAEMSRRELEAAIRERDEARNAVEAMRETVAAAESKAEEYRKQLCDALEDAEAGRMAADEEIETLRRQLEQLKDAPVAVETVVDQEAIERAREEEAERLQKKIQAAEKAKEQAERAKADAEQELAAVKVAQEEAGAVAAREKQAMAEQVEALQKKLAVASSSEMVIFKLHFEQGQQSINKMTESIGRIAEAGDTEGAEKLKNALRALLNASLGVLG